MPVSGPIDGTGKAAFSFSDASVLPASEYYYKVGYVAGTEWTYSSPLRAITPAAVFALRPARPNPTRGAARIDFEIARAGPASLAIYSVTGARVRTLLRRELPAGVGSASWDGLGDGSRPLPAGAYFARLTSSSLSLHQRLLLLP